MNKLNFNELFFVCDVTLCEVTCMRLCETLRACVAESAVSPLTIRKHMRAHTYTSSAWYALHWDQPKE